MKSLRGGRSILYLVLLFLWTTSLAAAPAQLQILLDADNNASTGCRVITNLGNVDGVEAIYTTTYDNGSDGKPVVTGVTKQTCAQPGTVNFNAPVTIDAGGWLVGTDASGNVFVETHIPTAELPTALHTHMRWYFIGVQGTNLELVLQNENNAPILFPEPPLSHPRIVGPMGARTIILDGKFDDWMGIHPLVSGLAVTGGGKFRFLGGVTAYATAGNVYFNFSIQSNSNAPQANDDGYTVLRGKSLYVGPTGVLANDFDPHGKPLTAVHISGPEHGALVLNSDGSFTYANDGSPAPIDGFRYKASNGSADSNTAHVTIGVVDCNIITVNPPGTTSGPVGSPFNQTFTQSGAIGAPVFTLASGTLPNGLTLGTGGTLSGTPTVAGSFPITVRVTDANNCTGVSGVYNLTITCQPITVTAPATTTGVAGAAFSQTFTQSGGIGATTFSTVSALPTGLTLSSGGVLSGTPTQTGTFPIVVTATDSHSCTGSVNYTLTITCQTITVTNPATATGTAAAAFSQTFTQTGAIGGATFTTASTLPTGLTLSAGGVLSGTPTQTGSFPIVVKVTDSNGCIGTGATYTLVINCQTITVTNPATTTGTVSSPFSQTFTAAGTIGAVTFTTASTLPAGLSLSAGGVLAGTPTQTGSFPIVVKATDANGCFGTGATYTLVIGCQTITVTNPATTTGTVSAPFSQSFSQTGAVGGATFTTASPLPGGLTLSAAGLLSGTPTQNGTFPIVVTVTDGNGCTGTGATYTLVINCQTITVTNPATTTATVGTAFNQSFSQTGAIGGATFTTASTLPTGLTLSAAGLLSGTPMQFGSFPIVVTVTDGNGCTGTGATYTLVVTCQTITVTNPGTTTGVAAAPFSQTFTQSGAIGGATFTTASTLPTGLSLSVAGVLSGTPTQTGTFPIVVTVTDGNGCSGTGSTYNLTINCQTINVTNPATTTGTVNTPFSQTFTQTGAIGTATFTLASGVLPSSVDPIHSKAALRFRIKNDTAGLTLSPSGVLSGTPTQKGTFPITVLVTDSNGCTGVSATYNLVIGCQIINVTNPATSTGTVNAPFSQGFTASNTIGTVTFSTASTLPTGMTLDPSTGIISGTPTQSGSFPIVVTATDANGCSGNGPTFNLVIGCQTITVTKPVNASGTVSTPFSEQFTQSGAVGTATFTTASPLPSGITLSSGGLLAGTPLQQGAFPIVVTVTDSNGCTGTSATYNLNIGCQLITVGNPGTISWPAGTPLSINFTQSGAIGTATFTTASTLPTGLTLAANGTLSGTPSQGGSFPISVTVTDSNGCTGTNPPYTLTITCPTITVTNPGVSTGTAGTAFSQTFTQSGGIGTITWSKTGSLPAGITLNSASGVLSGTTTQVGTFPITVTATDSNGCQGIGATYNLTFNCQTVTVTNPGVNTGTVDAAFSQTFTVTGILGTVTWSETGALPAGITLNSASGVLSGTPTVNGSFPITVKATDTNGCLGTSSYTLTINCQTITVTKPVVTTGTVGAPFSQTFTQSGAHGTATFTTASTLPGGLTLSTAGVLSGTPTQTGSFPIVVTVTDSNGCTGSSTTYTLTINCQTITVTNPATTTGTVGVLFSQTFTQSAAQGTATFTTASTLPTGFTLSTAGVLSGTTNQHGTFPIVVTVTDSNGCTGTGSTYNLVINCQTITVTNPVNTTGTVASPFSEQFNQSGAIGGATFTTASTLPTGLTLSSSGLLSGTPTQSGSFPIVVTVTDGNGCSGSGSTYTLVISCNTLTVTNPGVSTGTAGTLFSQQFTQTGGNGTITWSETGALPGGITLNTATGFLTGTTTVTGSFPITVTATDGNGCSGTGATYTLIINCQTITVTNPGVTSVQAGNAFDQAFTATGILGTATWSETGALPTGITLNSATGHLAGTTTQLGSFPITVKATDSNGCFGTGATYTLTVTCPVITVTRTGGGSFPAGVIGTVYAGQSFSASGGGGTYTFAVTSGTFPPGLTLAAGGGISGTPTATGTFSFTVTGTDTGSLCPGAQLFTIAINPKTTGDSYSTLVDNTHAVVTGGSTASPGTPFVSLSGTIISNDLPAGGVTASAGTFATTAGGSVTIAADGTFIYTPKANPGAAVTTSDSFTYTISSDTGGTGTPTSATGTVTLSLTGRVWYVKNNGGGTDGRSHSPFTTLAAAAAASTAGDIIFVYNGDGTTTGQNAGITLKANQQLIGEGVALVVNAHTLVAAGTKPQITNATAASDAVTLNDGNTVKGLTITGATRDGISSVSAHAGFTGDTLTVQNNTNVGVDLISMTGAVTITNSTISTVGNQALTINNGTAAVTVDNTNTINGGTGTAVSVLNRPGAAGAIAIGATINNGQIQLLSNTSGTISFTGSQTLSNTTVAGVTMTTNTGATVNFSGTLNITTTTGNGFVASGGGTLNVTGTANITTGAAANGLSLNGMTIGGSGVTFTSVSTTGATTGINLVNFTAAGTVTVNGGTITNGTTGVSLQGTNTSLSLAGVTITGPTTGITNTTNFGTLTIGASVNVSAATALNLVSGAVSGTFANVSSTGGTNGVNLNGVTGTWGATAGSLTGATGATFNVTGGSGGTISWGGTINQANGANVVTIAGTNTNTINFSGNVTTSGTSTGISIGNSSGTYDFTGAASTIAGSGGGVVIATEGGTVSFGSGMSITAATTSFSVTSSTANITYSGTITNNNNGGVLLNVATYSTGTLTMNGTSLSGNVAGANGVIATLSNVTGTVAVNNLSLTSSNVGFNNTLVAITGVNTGGSITFNHLTLSATGSNHTGKGLTMVGNGTLNITATGGTSSIDVSSVALDLNGQALANGGALATVNSSGGVNGIKLTNVTGGTWTIGAGTIAGNTGSAFLATGSNVTFIYNGTITQNTAGQKAVDLSTLGGGTISFGGLITSSGGNGISYTGTAATVNFTGGMTLSTGGADAFTATGGGVVNVSGTNNITTTSGKGINWNTDTSGTGVTFNNVTSTTGAAVTVVSSGASNFTFNTVTSTTGTAVSVTTATGDFVFTKINSNGAAKGISVNALTGGGSFTVNGTGGLCDSTHISGTDCTGGTIQGGTTRGAEFINAVGVTLNNMYFKGNATSNSGATCFDHINNGTNTTCNASVFLSSTTGPTLNKLYLDGTGTGDMGLNGNTVSGLTIGTMEVANYTANLKDAIVFQNLTGTVGITGLNVHNNTLAHNFFVTNNTGTANITLTSPIIQNSPLGGVGQGNADGINVQSYNAGTTLNITSNNGTFNNIIGDTTNWAPNSGSHMTAVLSGGTSTSTGGIYMASTGNNTQFTYTITGLTSVTTNSTGSNAITVGRLNGTSITETGTISNNVIVTGSSTCSTCSGIVVNSFATSGLATISITGNTVGGNNFNGLNVAAGGGSNSLNLTVQGNTFSTTQLSANDGYAIDLSSGNVGGDTDCYYVNLGDMSATHNVPANRNTITGTNWVNGPGGNTISLVSFQNSTMHLQGLTTFTDAGAAAWTSASNVSGGTDAFSIGANNFAGGPVCP